MFLGSRLAPQHLPHLLVVSLCRMWHVSVLRGGGGGRGRLPVVVCLRLADTVFRRLGECRLRPPLSRDGVEQIHGDSLFRLLEGRYQVLYVPEISFWHTRGGLKQKQGRERSFFVVIPDQTDTAINLWRFTVYKTSDIGEKKKKVEARMKAQELVWVTIHYYYYIGMFLSVRSLTTQFK